MRCTRARGDTRHVTRNSGILRSWKTIARAFWPEWGIRREVRVVFYDRVGSCGRLNNIMYNEKKKVTPFVEHTTQYVYGFLLAESFNSMMFFLFATRFPPVPLLFVTSYYYFTRWRHFYFAHSARSVRVTLAVGRRRVSRRARFRVSKIYLLDKCWYYFYFFFMSIYFY